jgi:hypothetical protein
MEKSGSYVTNDQRRSCKHQGVYNYNVLTLLAGGCLQGFGGGSDPEKEMRKMGQES